MKYTIEITNNGISKIFIDENNVFSELVVRKDSKFETIGESIADQLKRRGYDEELIKLIQEGDLFAIANKLNELNKIVPGVFIKDIIECRECKIKILSKYSNGLFGYPKSIRYSKNVETGEYTISVYCPVCRQLARYKVKAEDLEDTLTLKRTGSLQIKQINGGIR